MNLENIDKIVFSLMKERLNAKIKSNEEFYENFSPEELKIAAKVHNTIMSNLSSFSRPDYMVDETLESSELRKDLSKRLSLAFLNFCPYVI